MKVAKKKIAILIVFAMILQLFPEISVKAETLSKYYEYDTYTVEYKVINEWDGGQQVEIVVTNISSESIYNWALKTDINGSINGIWNASIYEQAGTEYILKNDGHNYEIKPNQNVHFGFQIAGEYFENPEDFILVSKRTTVDSLADVTLIINDEWENGVKGEIVINNMADYPLEAWMLNVNTNFDITDYWGANLLERNENTYSFCSELWTNPIGAGESKSIGFTATIESNNKAQIYDYSISIVKIDSLEIDWEDETDTDGDGITDVYELNVYGSNPNKVDTDEDGLPDGYEAITLRTNPILPDTDENGVSDADEDFDTDGLSNYEEYLLGTDPYNSDTDEDYLQDGDEVNLYDTDPLNPDTDGDGIGDGDEIELGINPNDETDGDKPIHQVIDGDSLSMNNLIQEFKISIDIVATDNVKNYIEEETSGYSGLLEDNRSIVGQPVYINYDVGTVESGTITFTLDENYLKNNKHYFPELNLGIERYGVFIYDDDINTLVPIDCIYDDVNNTISIDISYMGDLAIIDYESLMYDLGIDPNDKNKEEEEYSFEEFYFENKVNETENIDIATGTDAKEKSGSQTETENQISAYNDISHEDIENIISSSVLSKKSKAKIQSFSADTGKLSQVDLVLVIDTTGSMGSQIAAVKANIAELINKLRNDGISLYVSIIDFRDITCDGKDSTKVNCNLGEDFYNQIDDITDIVSALSPNGGGDTPECALDGLGAAYNLDYRKSASKYIFLITDAKYKNNNNYDLKDMSEVADMLNEKGICTSVVTEAGNYSTYENLTTITGGSLVPMAEEFCDNMYEVIYNRTPRSTVIIANSLVTGHFKEPLVYNGSCDTDGDTLSDSTEVDWSNINLKDDGSYELLTWEELSKKSKYASSENNALFNEMKDIHVIPAKYNPFSKDTDGDYYPDNEDTEPLKMNPMLIYDPSIDDSSYHTSVDDVIKIYPAIEGLYSDASLESLNSTNEEEISCVFTRRGNEVSTFTLTPGSTSFYKISCAGNVAISYKGGFLNKKTYTVNKQSDGTYLLKGGVKYTIKTSTSTKSNYKFIIAQDNWVYAPNGGKWTPIEYSGSSVSSGYLISGAMYITFDRLIETIEELHSDLIVFNFSTDGDIEAQVEEILRQTNMEVSDADIQSAALSIASLIASGLSTVSLFVATGPVKVLDIGLVALGDSLSLLGTPAALKTFDKALSSYGFKNALVQGNYNVYATKYYAPISNWNAWEKAPYINKIHFTDDIGVVDTNISNQDIIEWCEWE